VEILLWLTAGLCMGILLVCLCGRGLRELLGCKLTLPSLTAVRVPWWALFIASLAILWLGALFAYLGNGGGLSGFLTHFFQRMTQAGDGPHYQFIAENGYVSAGDEVNNIVFYPLYPFLTGILGRLLGGRTALAGMLLSQVCYGFSAVLFARLAQRTTTHPWCALLAYVLYPFGFFALGLFTEGLFLLLTMGALYAMTEEKWVVSGLCGLLCALCRTQGILLLLPGVYMAARVWKGQGWRWHYLWTLMPLVGFGLYLGLNKAVCGSFFAYQYYESIEPWWQTPQWLGSTVAQQWTMGTEYPSLAVWIYWPQLGLYFLCFALLLAGWKNNLDTALLLYGTAYLGMCYTASWLISGGRYMMGCVPMLLCVGRLERRGLRIGILLGELVLFGMYNYYFMQGQAIM
jgi:hypothetical protein